MGGCGFMAHKVQVQSTGSFRNDVLRRRRALDKWSAISILYRDERFDWRLRLEGLAGRSIFMGGRAGRAIPADASRTLGYAPPSGTGSPRESAVTSYDFPFARYGRGVPWSYGQTTRSGV